MKKFLVGLAAAAAVTVIPSTAAMASGKHGGATNSSGCTLSASTVNAPMTLSGSGYTPGASYGIVFVWPDSSAVGTSATASPSGQLSVSVTAYQPGTYTGQVQSAGKVVGSCSATVS